MSRIREAVSSDLPIPINWCAAHDGCVGLKTGSTSVAKYCVSAVARRNGITLISVVMTAPDYKVRFKDAAAMLNLGFGSCKLYTDEIRSPRGLYK